MVILKLLYCEGGRNSRKEEKNRISVQQFQINNNIMTKSFSLYQYHIANLEIPDDVFKLSHISELTLAAKQLGYNMPPDFSKHMSDEQLQQEFTKFRSLAQKTNVTNKDKSLRKGLDQMTPAERLAQNLNGVNTSTLDATQLKIFP